MQAFTGSSHTADNAATAGAVDYGAGDTEKVVGVGRHGVPSVAKAMEALGSALRIVLWVSLGATFFGLVEGRDWVDAVYLTTNSNPDPDPEA